MACLGPLFQEGWGFPGFWLVIITHIVILLILKYTRGALYVLIKGIPNDELFQHSIYNHWKVICKLLNYNNWFKKVVSDDDKIDAEITDETLNDQTANANYRQNRYFSIQVKTKMTFNKCPLQFLFTNYYA